MSRISVRAVDRRDLLKGLGAGAVAGCAADPEVVPNTIDPIAPITPNEVFYVTTCCGTPGVDLATWVLVVRDGPTEVGRIGWSELDEWPAQDREHTLECIGASPHNLAISNAVWSGTPLRDLLAALGVQVPSSAVEIVFTSLDGYWTSLPIADLDLPVWLVWRMNGEPLPAEHGAPVRLLVPGRYGMKNPKWITELAFVDAPQLGFWEEVGYSNEAPYRPNALILHPPDGSRVEPGTVELQGAAFAGSDPIVSVEVSVDGGPWQPAPVTYGPGADIWTLWAFSFEPSEGDHDVAVRCTTASGRTSDPNPEGTDPFAGYDGSMQVGVSVG